MRRKGISSLVLASVLLGTVLGYFLGGAGGERSAERVAPPREDGSAAEIALLKKRIDDLLQENRKQKEAAGELAEKLKSREEAAEQKPAAPSKKRSSGGAPPYELASLDQAQEIFQEAMKKYDVQGLLDLATVLIGMGEEGYEKILALFEQMFKDAREDRTWELLLGNEMYAGRFLRAVAEHSEDVLRFALYLERKDPETLSPTMKDLQREFQREIRSELGSILLGFYDGEDPEIQEGYFSLIRSAFDEEQDGSRDRRSIHALAQIQTAAAADLLIGLAEKAPPSRLPEIVSALWYQRSPRALPVLRSLRASVSEPQLGSLIDAAIRSLE